MDNFNWGVRRPSLSHLEGASADAPNNPLMLSSGAESLTTEETPVMHKRDHQSIMANRIRAEESSDDELGSVRH